MGNGKVITYNQAPIHQHNRLNVKSFYFNPYYEANYTQRKKKSKNNRKKIQMKSDNTKPNKL